MSEESPLCFQELIDWGLNASTHHGKFIATGKAPVYGRPLIDCILGRARQVGVNLRGNLVIRAIAAEDDCVLALGWSPEDESWTGLVARALVVAGGGAGGLYLRHDNPQRNIGDSYALGYLAGAALQDMEFVQFFPLGLADPSLPSAQASLVPPALADKGRLINQKDQDILAKYGITERPAGIKARDRLSQALFAEMEQEGQEVWLDVTRVSKDEWCSDPFSASTWKHLGSRCGMRQRPVKVAPIAHFFVGGLCIDTHGATNLAGVFAAGESTGGVHGANRMGGNALTETIVFGTRAGKAAAACAQGRRLPDSENALAKLSSMLPAQGPGKPKQDANTLKTELKRIMWRYGGIRRSREGLEKGLSLIDGISREVSQTSEVTDAKEFLRLQELQMASVTARLILESALRRQESRGCHFREEFPQPDDSRWLGHNRVVLQKGQDQWSFEKID
jgi:aspartate oxidase